MFVAAINKSDVVEFVKRTNMPFWRIYSAAPTEKRNQILFDSQSDDLDESLNDLAECLDRLNYGKRAYILVGKNQSKSGLAAAQTWFTISDSNNNDTATINGINPARLQTSMEALRAENEALKMQLMEKRLQDEFEAQIGAIREEYEANQSQLSQLLRIAEPHMGLITTAITGFLTKQPNPAIAGSPIDNENIEAPISQPTQIESKVVELANILGADVNDLMFKIETLVKANPEGFKTMFNNAGV